jgi:glycosyltransferase involved in cell wall biosynthesis
MNSGLPAGTRVAIVHHWFIRRGGAERVVEQLAAVYPQAEVFTLVSHPRAVAPILRGRIHTSYLQHWPGSRRWHRYFMPFFPMALESLDLTGFDVVISSESGPAKGVLTRADACHICYCHTPMRYIWEMPHRYRGTSPAGVVGRTIFSWASHYMRLWDYATAARVDHFVASSRNGAQRIRKVYRRSADIIYPPVEIENFQTAEAGTPPEDFYLALSRLVSYKRIDLAIEASRRLGRRLVVIGDGEEKDALRRLAGPNTEFKTGLDDAAVSWHLRHCRALLFPGEEDIGLVPIEAQACGRPVIAYGRGGALETVVPLTEGGGAAQATGVLFYEQSVEAVMAAMQQYEAVEAEWSPARIRAHARQFDAARFRDEFADLVSRMYHASAVRAAVAG